MRYPHVVGLKYRLEAEEWAEFSDPPPAQSQTDSFYIRVDKDLVTVWMREHHTTSDSARGKVEEYLRRWEILSALNAGRSPLMHFECETVEILDLEEPFASTHTKPVGASMTISWSVLKTDTKYPTLPDNFALSSEVEVMWTLYNRYVQGNERLLPMAYTCLTWFIFTAGSLEAAAQQYGISRSLLTTLRKLSSTLGSGVEARKMEGSLPRLDPTPEEVRWIEAAVRALIKRAGEYAADSQKPWQKITNAELPPL